MDWTPTRSASASDWLGELSKRFQVRRLLGSGGMGVVLEAHDHVLGRSVAVKLVRCGAGAENRARRLLREAEAVARLRSRHVAQVLDFGWVDGHSPFIVMELLHGRDLATLLRTEGPMPLALAGRHILEACDALIEAHAAGVIHRDLKPSNLFVVEESDSQPLTKVLDFGLAKIVRFDVAATTLTQGTHVVGTPRYMAPEQLTRQAPLDERVDVWALGVSLYELLSGRTPFGGASGSELVHNVLSSPPRRLSQELHDVPPDLDALLLRCLEKAPEDRFDDLHLFASELEQVLAVSSSRVRSSAGPPGPPLGSPASFEASTTAESADPISESSMQSPQAAPASVTLPSELTDFIGRRQELLQVEALLGRHRLVTLTGAGGSGKTRLALRVAGRSLAQHPDGVFFIPFDEVRAPSLVATVMASALKLSEQPGRSALELLVTHLADKRSLLVVDNFEHLRSAATVLSTLLQAAPKLRLLVTSRALLRLRSEHAFEVPTMSVPPPEDWDDPDAVTSAEAVELFVGRARSVDPHFSVSRENAAAVAHIVTRLDGLPLALELAAARLRFWTPSALAERLPSLLEAGNLSPSDLPERQRTLGATLAWSHRLLQPKTQVVFRRLGCFVGAFSIAAARAVVEREDTGPAEDALEELVAVSLLQRRSVAGAPQLGMLETIREFALRDLEAHGEIVESSRRHLCHYVEWAEQLEPQLTRDGQEAAISCLDAQQPNLRAALDFALTHREIELGLRLAAACWRYWHNVGRPNEGRTWLDCLLASGEVPPSVRAKALNANAGLAYWQAQYEPAYALYEEALTLYRKIGDELGEADTLFSMSTTNSWRGDPAQGDEQARMAQEIFERLGARNELAKVLMARGFALWMQKRLREARPFWEHSRRLVLEAGDRIDAGAKSLALASLTYQEGNPKGALREAIEALLELIELKNQTFIVMALDWIASIGTVTDARRAVTLAAVAHRHRRERGGGVLPGSVGLPNPRDAAADHLPEDQVEQCWVKGQSLSIDQAVSLARDWYHDLSPSGD